MSAVNITDGIVYANLTNSAPNNQMAAELQLELEFYQEGMMRARINCTGEEERFSISEHGIGVEWSQLNRTTNYT